MRAPQRSVAVLPGPHDEGQAHDVAARPGRSRPAEAITDALPTAPCQADPRPPVVEPPDDEELLWYLGPQRRWVQLLSVVAFVLAATSLTRFSLTSPWLYPLLGLLGVSVLALVLSMISGLNRRRDSRTSHLHRVDTWHGRTPDHEVPSVDVFLPSCGEDLEVLRNTYTFVERMRWRGELDVWVLDDANLPKVRELALEFGFNYRVRPDRGHLKKAGNLRAGFRESDGDLIVVLDADFSPRADFLDHTVPYMEDPGVGIVQTPQFFGTSLSMNWLERTAGATQELFYRWVQPSRDRGGAPICVGTCAVYRRDALRAVGGFAEIEHSEDVHTGIKLTRAGYSVRYVPVLVSRGLCPDDLQGFLNQQYRWCNGSMSLLVSGQANRHPLTLRQRIAYWSGFMYYISTAINVFVLHVPGMLMAVFFADQVRADHYVPFLAGAWVYFVLLPAVMRSHWRFEVLRVQMAYSFAHALAIIHKLTGRTAGWVATGAVGRKSDLASTIATVGIVTISLTLAISWAALAYDVHVHGWAEFWMMGLFLLGYTYLAAPLLVTFVAVVAPRSAARPALAPDLGRDRPGDRTTDGLDATEEGGRATAVEVVSYTAVIALVAAVAAGWFDTMVPWL
jgi:cellulose synthase (UDP-forming)